MQSNGLRGEKSDYARSITTYAELQTAIGNWLDHSLFTARIPALRADPEGVRIS